MNIDRVEQLRTALGLSQEQAAKASGFKARSNWNNIVKGRSHVTVEQLEAIAGTLGVPPGELLTPRKKPRPR